MEPGIEALGEAVTGGLAARAVEPEAGEGTAGGGGLCLNCGTALIGPHCHNCGQAAHVHRTVSAFLHDLAHGVFHFEGKIWRTLPLLAWRPGELTRRYVDGQRASFVSPIALFLFSVFVMFAVLNLVQGPIGTPGGHRNAAEKRVEAQHKFERKRGHAQQELDALRAERGRLVAAGKATGSVDARISTAEAQLALQERLYRDALDRVAEEEKREAEIAKAEAAEDARTKPGAARIAAREADEGKFVVVAGADSVNDWFNESYKRAKENPKLLAYKLQTNAYKFSWLLIPISVPFLWLLFLHRRRYRERFKAYDHIVFVTYSIAFMSLALIALSLLRAIGLPTWISVLTMILVPPVHIYRQLKGAYGLSRLSALWRTFVLLVFSVVALGIFGMILLALGVLH